MGVTLIIQESEALPRFELFDSIQAARIRVGELRRDDDFFGCAYLEGTRVLVKDTSLEELIFVNNKAQGGTSDVVVPEASTRDVAIAESRRAAPGHDSAHAKVQAPLLPPAVGPSRALDPFDLDAVTRAARESVTMMVETQRQCSLLVLKAGEDAQAVVAKAIKQTLATGAVAQANARKAVQDTILSRAEMLGVLDTERALQISQAAELRARVQNKDEAAVVAQTRGAVRTSALAKVGARVWDYWGK